jgi:hypothetical protein
MNKESFYLVDERVGVQPLTSYLSKVGTWADTGKIDPSVSNGRGR